MFRNAENILIVMEVKGGKIGRLGILAIDQIEQSRGKS